MSGLEDETLGRPSDEEALTLTLSFYCILEPDKRMQVLALAQQFARESRRVDGFTHFTDLDPAIGSKPKSPG
jgi:hypothetical protein